jgi:competence protein ComEA
MNPFLHDTVARPLDLDLEPAPDAPVTATGARPARPCPALQRPAAVPARQRAGRGRWPRRLRMAGLLALVWAGSAGAVDLNAATLDQLQGIRGIGPKTARIILDERDRGGRYLSFADLSDRVRGIGPRRAQAMQSAGLTIDGGGTRLSGQGAEARPAAGAPPSGTAAPMVEAPKKPARPPR